MPATMMMNSAAMPSALPASSSIPYCRHSRSRSRAASREHFSANVIVPTFGDERNRALPIRRMNMKLSSWAYQRLGYEADPFRSRTRALSARPSGHAEAHRTRQYGPMGCVEGTPQSVADCRQIDEPRVSAETRRTVSCVASSRMSRIGTGARNGPDRDEEGSRCENGTMRSSGANRLLVVRKVGAVRTTRSLVSSAGGSGRSGSSCLRRRESRSDPRAVRASRTLASGRGLACPPPAHVTSDDEQPNNAARSHVGNGAVNGARIRTMSHHATPRDTMRSSCCGAREDRADLSGEGGSTKRRDARARGDADHGWACSRPRTRDIRRDAPVRSPATRDSWPGHGDNRRSP